MNQEKLNQLFNDAIESLDTSDFSNENILARLDDAADGKKTIDNENLAAFLLVESKEYTQALIHETLSKIFVDNNDEL